MASTPASTAIVAQLAAILDKIHRPVGRSSATTREDYDLPVLRAVLAGADAYPGLARPRSLRRLGTCRRSCGIAPPRWPRIPADHIDLAARTRMNGRIPALKTIAANLGAKHLQELPYPPDQELTDAEWAEVRQYNQEGSRGDPAPARPLRPGTPGDRGPLAAVRHGPAHPSTRPGSPSQILCSAYRDRHGQDPGQDRAPGERPLHTPSRGAPARRTRSRRRGSIG